MDHQLFRSSQDAILGGVCGGLGSYLTVSPSLFRIFFVILTVFSGLGIVVYFLLWILIPRQELSTAPGGIPASRGHQFKEDVDELVHRPNTRALTWLGVALIASGLGALIQVLHLPFLSWLNSSVVWAAAIVAAGGVLIYRALKG